MINADGEKEPPLLPAGQDPEIVKGAVMYLQLSAPALWFYVIAECLKRYLLAQVQLHSCHARSH